MEMWDKPQIGPKDPFEGMDPRVAEYMRKKMNGMQPAQDQMDLTNMASVGAQAFDSIANANNQPIALENQMQNLGAAPKLIEGRQQHTDMSGLQRQAQQGLQMASQGQDQAVQAAFQNRKDQLAAGAAANKATQEQKNWGADNTLKQQSATETTRHNKAMEAKAKQIDPVTALMQSERLDKMKREAKQEVEELNVPGYSRQPGISQSKGEAEKTRLAMGVANNIKNGLTTLQAQMETNGNFEWGGSGGSAMAVTASDLRLQLKELNNLGVLSGPDLALMMQQIPDTEGFGQLLTQESTTKAQLNQVVENINRKIETSMAAKGYKASGSAQPTPGTESLTPDEQKELQELEKRFGGG